MRLKLKPKAIYFSQTHLSVPSVLKKKYTKKVSLINRSNVKKRMLGYSKTNRAGKYTRVSKATMDAAERVATIAIDDFCLKTVTDARGGKTL